jgi:hypothetical protein
VTGYCLGCKLYGLTWYVPSLFDRVLGVQPAVQRTPLVRVRFGRDGAPQR